MTSGKPITNRASNQRLKQEDINNFFENGAQHQLQEIRRLGGGGGTETGDQLDGGVVASATGDEPAGGAARTGAEGTGRSG